MHHSELERRETGSDLLLITLVLLAMAVVLVLVRTAFYTIGALALCSFALGFCGCWWNFNRQLRDAIRRENM